MKKRKTLQPNLSLNKMCSAFNKSKQVFYKRERTILKRNTEETDKILDKVKYIKKKLPMLGGRKLKYMLARRKIHVGRDYLFDILRRHRMLVRRKRKYARTTHSNHWFRKHDDLLKSTRIERPEQVFVSDITYVRVKDGFSYLSLVTDIYSKKIMGHSLHRSLSKEGTVVALKEALQNRIYDSPLLHHSDRGFQYCSHEYINILVQNNVLVSMTQSGSPYDNAVAERVNGILKTEIGLDYTFENHEQAEKTVRTAIHLYNTKRPHLSCGYLTPQQAHKTKKPLRKEWKKRNRINKNNFNEQSVILMSNQ